MMASPGDTVFPTLQQLRNVGQYIQTASLVTCDGGAPDYDDPDRAIPFLNTPTMTFAITAPSAKEQQLRADDLSIELRVPPISATSNVASPNWSGLNIARRLSVPLYGPHDAQGNDDWMGSGGVNSPNAAGQFAVTGAGNLKLTLACGYEARLDRVPLQTAPAGCPTIYCYKRADIWYTGAVSNVTDWKTPNVVLSVPGDDPNAAPWTNPERAMVSDDQWTRAPTSTIDRPTPWLRAQNFNFTIADLPEGQPVNGIEVVIERNREVTGGNSATNLVRDYKVYLRKTAVGRVGDNKASATLWPLTTDAEEGYGDSSDLWGATFTGNDVRLSEFGLDLEAWLDRDDASELAARVDAIKMRIYYGWIEIKEAIYCWLGFEELALPLTAPDTCTLTVVVTYRRFTYSDNHLSDSTRQTTFTYAYTTHTATFSVAVVAGAQTAHVCLMAPSEAGYPFFERVLSMAISGFASGDWVIAEPTLVSSSVLAQAKLKTFEGYEPTEGQY